MPENSARAASAAIALSLLFSCHFVGTLVAAEPAKPSLESAKPSLDSLWATLAERSAATAYGAARQIIERGDESAAYLAAKIPTNVRLPRRVPYESARDLQFHRAAYVLDCLGTPAARKVRARISYSPAAEFKPYQEKPRADSLGDPLPSGAVFRWGTDRFFVGNGAAQMGISNDGKLAATLKGGTRSIDRQVIRRVAAMRILRSNLSIQIVDMTTGLAKCQLPVLALRSSALCFTRDSKHVVYCSDGEIVVADVSTGAVIDQFSTNVGNPNVANPVPMGMNVVTFALSADEKTLYAGYTGGELGVFEFPGGQLLAQARAIANRPITGLHATAEFVSVEIGGGVGVVSRLWDVRKKDWATKKAWGDSPALRYALSSDEKHYARLLAGGKIELRLMSGDAIEKEFTLQSHMQPQFAPAGQSGRERFEYVDADHLLVADWMGNADVVSTITGKAIWSGRDPNYRSGASLSANGRYLLGSDAGRLMLIDLTTGRNLVEPLLAGLSNPYFTISGDGQTALAIRDGKLRQLDPSTFEPLGEIKMPGHPRALSYDGRFCVAEDPAAVWEPASGTQFLPLNDLPLPAAPRVTMVASGAVRRIPVSGLPETSAVIMFHPNGRWLIVEPRPGTPYSIVDLWTGSQRPAPCPSAGIVCAPDGGACLYRDPRTAQWACCDFATGKLLWRGPSGSDWARIPQWFEGGRYAACCNATGAGLEVCDARDGRVVDTIGTAGLPVWNAAIAPDGSGFAVPSGTDLQLYEQDFKKPTVAFPAGGIEAHYLPNGRFVVVADQSGMTTICDFASAAAKRRPGETAAAQMARLWPDLAGADAPAAFAASWAFVAAGDEAVAFLRQRLWTDRELGDGDIRTLIARLDSDNYHARQAAYESLLEHGRPIVPRLKQAAEDTNSLEVELSLDKLLDVLNSNRGSLLLSRAGFILRQIGTPQAEELLSKLGEYSAQKAFSPQPAPRGP